MMVLTVDLTPFRKITGNIIPNNPIELKMVEMYSSVVTMDKNTVREFTNYITGMAYKKTGVEYDYAEINTFYNLNNYQNIILRFYSLLTHYISSKVVDPNFNQISFSRVISDDEKYLVEFRVEYDK